MIEKSHSSSICYSVVQIPARKSWVRVYLRFEYQGFGQIDFRYVREISKSVPRISNCMIGVRTTYMDRESGTATGTGDIDVNGVRDTVNAAGYEIPA